MAKPVRKYGTGAITVAVFEKTHEDGNVKEYYSLQKGRKVGDKWENESILLTKEQLAIVLDVVGQALSGGEGSSSPLQSSSADREILQVIEVMDWGLAEDRYPSGEVKHGHDFLVHADNAIVAVGIGDIDEAISEVRAELEGKGYRNIKVKHVLMKPDEKMDDGDLTAWMAGADAECD